MTDQEIRLQFGEMTAAEMRLARAIVGWHERQVEDIKKWDQIKEMAVDNVLRILPELNASPSWEDAANNVRTFIDGLKSEQASLRAAADAMFTALNDCREDTCELIAERDWWKDEPRCRYDVRYQEMKDRLNAAITALAAYQATKP